MIILKNKKMIMVKIGLVYLFLKKLVVENLSSIDDNIEIENNEIENNIETTNNIVENNDIPEDIVDNDEKTNVVSFDSIEDDNNDNNNDNNNKDVTIDSNDIKIDNELETTPVEENNISIVENSNRRFNIILFFDIFE
jgi:hypothetical protein